jgi:hypothetical protein
LLVDELLEVLGSRDRVDEVDVSSSVHFVRSCLLLECF